MWGSAGLVPLASEATGPLQLLTPAAETVLSTPS